MSTPYIGFGNDTLNKQPKVNEGDKITCDKCGKEHVLEAGTSNGEKSHMMYFYKCGKSSYLGAINQRSVVGVKSDVSGKL